MTSEDYVNKELMPLLLEKGCFLDKVFVQDFRPIWYTKESNAPTWQDCDAYYIPTQSQVLKWLREQHELLISINPTLDKDGYLCVMYYIWDMDDIEKEAEKSGLYSIENYNQCVDASIKYCLENLI